MQMEKLVITLNDYQPPRQEPREQLSQQRVQVNQDNSQAAGLQLGDKPRLKATESWTITPQSNNNNNYNLPGGVVSLSSSVPGGGVSLSPSVPGGVVSLSSSVPGGVVTLSSSVPGGVVSLSSSVQNSIDTEWIETERCTVDKLFVLNRDNKMSSSTDIDYSSSECIEGLSSSKVLLSDPDIIRAFGKDDTTATTDIEPVPKEIIQPIRHSLLGLLVNTLLLVFILLLLLLLVVVVSQLSHINIIVTPLLSYVRGPPPM